MKRMINNLKYHFVDSAALVVETTPIFSALETGVGMSYVSSRNARLLAAGIAFAGMGYLFGKGRDLSRKLLKITDQTKEKIQQIHDIGYTTAFNITVSPPLYAISQTIAGENIDLGKIMMGTAAAVAFSAVNGAPLGYAVDVFRDLSGLKECDRPLYPKFLKRQNHRVKKGILAGLIGASVGISGMIYSLTPNAEHKTAYQERPTTEQRVEALDYGRAGQSLENLTQEISSNR